MPRSLRIAVWYNLPSGGARRALYDQVKGLQSRGHHIEIWKPDVKENVGGFADLGDLVQEHALPFATAPIISGNLIARTVYRLQYRRNQIERMRQHSAECARQIEAAGFDLLYAHNDTFYNAPFIGREIKGIPKVLYIQEPHRRLYEATPLPMWIPKSLGGVRLDKRFYRTYTNYLEHTTNRFQMGEELWNARAYDRLLVNSYFSRESILRAYGKESIDARVCYLGLDLDRFQNLHRPRGRFVIGLGTIDPAKNVEGAIRAVATISRARPALVWVGGFSNSEFVESMKRLASTLNVDLNFKIKIPDEELLELLSTAGAMVYAPHLEPFGYAPLEANACGVAVAAVAEGGVRETIVNGVNGILAHPDPVSLGRAIEQVLDDPAMGERAEKHVRAKWGLERSIDEVECHLREVAGK